MSGLMKTDLLELLDSLRAESIETEWLEGVRNSDYAIVSTVCREDLARRFSSERSRSSKAWNPITS